MSRVSELLGCQYPVIQGAISGIIEEMVGAG